MGAHPDDIELGCGGALLAHRRAGHQVTMLVMTSGDRGPQGITSRRNEQEEAARILGVDLLWGDFPDCAIPEGQQSTAAVEAAVAACGADMIYTHTINDSHQDHRVTAAATLSAARRISRVLCYEAPSSLGFAPSVYVDVDSLVESKTDLLRAHMSQVLSCGLVDLEAIEAQARYRGFQARLRHAEAFETPRLLLDIHATPRTPYDATNERRAAVRPPLTTPITATSVQQLATDGLAGQESQLS